MPDETLEESQECEDDSSDEDRAGPVVPKQLPFERPVLGDLQDLPDTLVVVEESPVKGPEPTPEPSRPSLAQRFRPHLLQKLLEQAQEKLDAQTSQGRESHRLGLLKYHVGLLYM